MSALGDWMNTLISTVEALTPPDRTDVHYQCMDGQERGEGTSSDRTFSFDDLSSSRTIAERGAAYRQIEWSTAIALRLVGDGYTRTDFVKRQADEVALILKSIDTLNESALPSGVLSVITEGHQLKRMRDEVVIRFPMRVLTGES